MIMTNGWIPYRTQSWSKSIQRRFLGSLSLSSKKCWISWDHTWSCYAACVLCVVQPEQWNGASHTFETWRKLPWHTPGKWKNAILPAQEPKKSNKKMIKISSSWAPHKNSGHMWSALQCSCNASKLPLSNSNREIHAEQGRTNTPLVIQEKHRKSCKKITKELHTHSTPWAILHRHSHQCWPCASQVGDRRRGSKNSKAKYVMKIDLEVTTLHRRNCGIIIFPRVTSFSLWTLIACFALYQGWPYAPRSAPWSRLHHPMVAPLPRLFFALQHPRTRN